MHFAVLRRTAPPSPRVALFGFEAILRGDYPHCAPAVSDMHERYHRSYCTIY